MKKALLSMAAFVLTLASAQASVVINETNFPDENLLTSSMRHPVSFEIKG